MPTITLACNLIHKGKSYPAGMEIEVDEETLAQFPHIAGAAPEPEPELEAAEESAPEPAAKKVTKKKPSK